MYYTALKIPVPNKLIALAERDKMVRSILRKHERRGYSKDTVLVRKLVPTDRVEAAEEDAADVRPNSAIRTRIVLRPVGMLHYEDLHRGLSWLL